MLANALSIGMTVTANGGLCGAASALALMQTAGFTNRLSTPAALLVSAAAYALLRQYGPRSLARADIVDL